MLREISPTIWAYRNSKCRGCPLHKTLQNVCVMGRGADTAKIMLIGEAPGEAEARTGLPFMGRSGQLLNRLLNKLGMADMVYITNVCKCRPPENRTPTAGEINACSGLYLRTEIEIIEPEMIVLLGRTAIELFFRDFAFTRHYPIAISTGMKPRFQNVIPTWHPSYCLRMGQSAEKELLQALQRAKELVA